MPDEAIGTRKSTRTITLFISQRPSFAEYESKYAAATAIVDKQNMKYSDVHTIVTKKKPT